MKLKRYERATPISYIENDDVNIYMIRMSNNPVSMWYAGITWQTWNHVGYEVDIVEAVTPETMGNFLTFDTKIIGEEVREFTETEKAIFYSHLKVWEKIKDNDKPSIVLEHDAFYVSKDKLSGSMERYDLVLLGNCCPAASYYLNRDAAEDLYYSILENKIHKNVDFYITDRATMKFPKHSHTNWPVELGHYHTYVEPKVDEEVGTTIQHLFKETLN